MKLNNRTVLASTGKRPRSNASFVHTDTSLHWECSTSNTAQGLSLDGCDVRLVDWVSFEGADAKMVSIGSDEIPCL